MLCRSNDRLLLFEARHYAKPHYLLAKPPYMKVGIWTVQNKNASKRVHLMLMLLE